MLRAIDKNPYEARTFENLVELGAVELGIEVKCTKCASWSWYSLNEVAYDIKCGLCLRLFKFPVVAPNDSNYARWSYRVVGPFALPSYANGGYASALAIRFFGTVLEYSTVGITWSASQELAVAPKQKLEADFVLWYQRDNLYTSKQSTDVVFGEAKSFGREVFMTADVDRMKALALRFPCSILVFATMKSHSELSHDEISRISKLAEWGREEDKERCQTRAPVIVLTGTELFAKPSLRRVWQEIGGEHAKLIQPAMVRTDNLRVLANLTQQLYLGMPSYGEWIEEKSRKRYTRLMKRDSKQEGE